VRILLVEDDDGIALPLCEGLAREGYEVHRVATGRAALDSSEVDLILLDLRLPDLDGLEVCKQLRVRSRTPIIVVSARGEEIDRVLLLEVGADDYLVKPFGFRELVARIRAVMRRVGSSSDGPQRIGTLEMDRRTRRVRLADVEMELTPKEYGLLALLADDPGAVCTRSEIMDRVWDPHWYGPTKTLDVHVASLRRKLGDARWIETVRGVGFRLVSPAGL
jgi:DNA-binding response OmpR family regulator